MKLFYDHDGIKIYHGDCSRFRPPDDRFDLMLSDPPYGIKEAAGKNRGRGLLASPTDYGDSGWDDAPSEHLDDVRSLGINQIIFGGNFYDLPPTPCWLVWDKDNAGTDFADAELAWTNLKGAVRVFRYRWNGMLQQHSGRRKEARVHPTQKPLSLMRWCINQVPHADTVFDPYMGSGTTLLAAKLEGKQAVGIEREERYCEAAVERLRQNLLF